MTNDKQYTLEYVANEVGLTKEGLKYFCAKNRIMLNQLKGKKSIYYITEGQRKRILELRRDKNE